MISAYPVNHAYETQLIRELVDSAKALAVKGISGSDVDLEIGMMPIRARDWAVENHSEFLELVQFYVGDTTASFQVKASRSVPERIEA